MINVSTAQEYLEKIIEEDIHPRNVNIEDQSEYTKVPALLEEMSKVKPQDGKVAFLQGRSLALGVGCKQDFDAAIPYYRKAADLGYTDALYNLSMIYANEKYAHKDNEKHNSMMEECASYGNPSAMFSLGYEYQYAMFGKEKDLDKARYWYKKAADLGMPEAIEFLRKLENS